MLPLKLHVNSFPVKIHVYVILAKITFNFYDICMYILYYMVYMNDINKDLKLVDMNTDVSEV